MKNKKTIVATTLKNQVWLAALLIAGSQFIAIGAVSAQTRLKTTGVPPARNNTNSASKTKPLDPAQIAASATRKIGIEVTGFQLGRSYQARRLPGPRMDIAYTITDASRNDYVTIEKPVASNVLEFDQDTPPIENFDSLEQLAGTVQQFAPAIGILPKKAADNMNTETAVWPVNTPYRATVIMPNGTGFERWGSVVEAAESVVEKSYGDPVVKRSGQSISMVKPLSLTQLNNLLVSPPVRDEAGRSYAYIASIGALPPGALVTDLTGLDSDWLYEGQTSNGQISLTGSGIWRVHSAGCEGEFCASLTMPHDMGSNNEAPRTPSMRSATAQIKFRLPDFQGNDDAQDALSVVINGRTVPMYVLIDYGGLVDRTETVSPEITDF